MPIRNTIPAGTELRVAFPICAKRRSDGVNLWLSFSDRVVIDHDAGTQLDGRILCGTKVAVTLVSADLSRMTFTDGTAIVPGGATLSPDKPVSPAPAPPAAYKPPPAISMESGYLKGRLLLDFCDMPR